MKEEELKTLQTPAGNLQYLKTKLYQVGTIYSYALTSEDACSIFRVCNLINSLIDYEKEREK